MFCPKCATQNIDSASFCRVCGANISLVPQALTGQLPSPRPDELDHGWRRSRRRHYGKPTVEDGIRQIMTGVGFLAVAISIVVFAPAGRLWWFWLLIPAFTLLGKGISQLMRAKRDESLSSPTQFPAQQIPPADRIQNLPAPKTGELRPAVPSVTEGTTRHLGAEAATRHFDSVTGEEQLP
jgi:hypothetical protein